jgi:hypothetical protein
VSDRQRIGRLRDRCRAVAQRTAATSATASRSAGWIVAAARIDEVGGKDDSAMLIEGNDPGG